MPANTAASPRRARTRHGLVLATALTALMSVVPSALPAGAAPAPARLEATGLQTQHLRSALGIDDTTPDLTWQLTGHGRDVMQSAYRIQAASSPERLRQNRPDLWDSGQVASSAPRSVYAGKPLGSRDRVYWRVQLWSASTASEWSDIAAFETGLTRDEDWSGQWITHDDWRLSKRRIEPVVVDLPRTSARHVRLNVTELGLPLAETDPETLVRRLQLGEIEVRDSTAPETNHARGATVTAPRAARYARCGSRNSPSTARRTARSSAKPATRAHPTTAPTCPGRRSRSPWT
ncbi:hypothetical protein GCM10023080_027530 [Streptomyces pseudoechinosporeus]